ncbi:MAG: alpha-galactosidase [Clostridia bacterium]|nr:alpha-galactosidase [Clostridia bacterium]MDE7328345.1 alpha-galactosidase [Clostridia bacterium]
MEFTTSKLIKGLDIVGGKIVGSYLVNRVSGKRYDINGVEFGISFYVKSGIMRKKVYFDSAAAAVISQSANGVEFAATVGGVDWNVFVEYTSDTASGVLRKTVAIKVSDPELVIDYIQLDGFDASSCEFSWSIPKADERVFIPAYVTTMGQPYYVGDMFFGGEFPVADNRIEKGYAFSRYYIGRAFKDIANKGEYKTVPFVIGSGSKADFHTLRSEFFEYISTISAQPTKFRIQFNSWYDNMLDINGENIENSFRAIATGFEKVGLRALDCYVVDDGWIDYTSPKFWEFDSKKFEDGFNKESLLTKELGSTFGVWFGPRGGYTRQTVKYAKLLESIGYPSCRQSRDICTCNPRYIKDLCARMAEFCIKYNVSYFKIDGFAVTPCKSSSHGHPKGKGDGLYFYTYLWEEWTKGFEQIRKARPDVFLNVTSYAHCSPWFLKWCDAVWLNNCADMGYDGKGDDLSQCLNYRDGKYRDFFEVRQLQFPVSNLYNHEPCYARRNCNPPLRGNIHEPCEAHPTVVYNDEQFKAYLYTCMMRGTGFVELYFTPEMMDGEKYKIAATVLTWAEENFDVLRKSRFFGDSPEKGCAYGYYAKDGDRAILYIRNSSNEAKSYTLDEYLLDFGESKIEVEEFYPKDGEKFAVKGKLEINLSPYEIRLFNLKKV